MREIHLTPGRLRNTLFYEVGATTRLASHQATLDLTVRRALRGHLAFSP